jgi:hypothetical protein
MEKCNIGLRPLTLCAGSPLSQSSVPTHKHYDIKAVGLAKEAWP